MLQPSQEPLGLSIAEHDHSFGCDHTLIPCV
jgi:hypothetical protein